MSQGSGPFTPMPARVRSSVIFRAAAESYFTLCFWETCLSEFRDWDSCQPSKVLVLFMIAYLTPPSVRWPSGRISIFQMEHCRLAVRDNPGALKRLLELRP